MSKNQAGNSLSVFALLDGLRRRKLCVIIPTILVTAAFAAYAYYLPDRYRGEALLAAEQTTPPDFLKHIAPPPLEIQDHLWAVREVLFSRPVLEAGARQLKEYQNTETEITPHTLEEIKAHIDIKIDGEHAFRVSFDAGDRYDAYNVTNKLVETFVSRASDKHEKKTEEAAAVIDSELEALKRRLDDQSKKLHDYKSNTVHVLPEHMLENMRVSDSLRASLRELDSKIAEEESKKTAIQQQMEDLESKGVLDQPVVQEKTADEVKLEELRILEKQMLTKYTRVHPEVVQVHQQITDIEKALASRPKKGRSEPTQTYVKYSELKAELEGINQRLPSYRRDLQSIMAQMSSYSSRIEATPQVEKRIEDLTREYDVGQSQFHALLDKKQDATLAKGLAQSENGIAFAIVEPASLPTGPYSPLRERLLLMGLCAGLGLGLALAFVVEQNDTTFGTVDDFQAFTTLPVVGVIPNVPIKGRKKGARSPIVTVTDPESVAAEQYRILAMKVQQQCDAAQVKTVMITSAAGGEGKSLTAINLATALAASTEGEVLLVDADMRKPRVNEYLGLTVPSGMGFYNMLVNSDDDSGKYIEKVRNLSVVPGSVPTTNPIAALSSPKARALFEKLKQHYAYIVVDAPPTLPIADSHILSGMTDRVLFVVRARETPRELFQHAVESFDAGNLLGAVVNDVDYQRSRYAYAYEYYKKTA